MSATPTVVIASIRALRPITIEGVTFVRGESFAQVRCASEAHFNHFRRNLRWSAFEVVKTDEKTVKIEALAGVSKVTEAEVAKAADLRIALAASAASLKKTHAELDATRKRAKDHAGLLAGLTPAHLTFLDKVQAEQVIAAAKAEVDARQPKPAEPDPAEVARAAALAELMSVDGIGEATATRLRDVYNVTSLHALAAVLADEKGCATLVADPEAQISEKDLEHWRRQVGEPEPTNAKV
jgi:hypothetical protein